MTPNVHTSQLRMVWENVGRITAEVKAHRIFCVIWISEDLCLLPNSQQSSSQLEVSALVVSHTAETLSKVADHGTKVVGIQHIP